MTGRLIKIVEDYFAALRDVRGPGAGTPERKRRLRCRRRILLAKCGISAGNAIFR